VLPVTVAQTGKRKRTAYAAPAWAAEQRVRDVGSKAVLLTLAAYADEDFTCYPSQERIAAETEQSVRQVARQLSFLESLGLLSRSRRYVQGNRSSDRYLLHLDVTVEVEQDDPRRLVLSGGARPESSASLSPDSGGGVTGQQPSDHRPVKEGSPDIGGRGTPRTPRDQNSYKGAGGPTSAARGSRERDGQPCTVHHGETQPCRRCALDRQIEEQAPRPVPEPTADVERGAAAARAALAARSRT
jgi:hypothetical protein